MDKKSSGILPFAVSLLSLTAAAVLLEVFCAVTRYLPLCLAASFCLLPALINAALWLCGVGDGREIIFPQKPLIEGRRRAISFILGTAYVIKLIFCRIRRFLTAHRTLWAAILTFSFLLCYQIYFILKMNRLTSLATVSWTLLLALVVTFLTLLVLEKWCRHSAPERGKMTALLLNLRSAMIIARLVMLLCAVSVLLKLLNIYDAQRPLTWAMLAVWIYCTVFWVCTALTRLIKKELLTNPRLTVPVPFMSSADGDGKLITYLENNTGLTLRSLWSIKFVKSILPVTVLAVALLFWLGTGAYVIEAYQQGALYRLGRLCDEPLTPGIHLTLPWPFDSVKTYDTESVSKITIGYRSTADTDNVWTDSHGSSEYKLLLGGGNELVSINLRLEYKISDLTAYLRTSSSPEKMLEAKAYELVTDKTINTDLSSILSVDRSAFAEDFKAELDEYLAEHDIGLSVVSVVLESIHPPVEVAAIYQKIVSAGIESEQLLLEAQGKAAVTLANAEASYDSALSAANSDYYTKTAEAGAAVAEFMASVSADNEASASYRYYKYMNAIGSSYRGARLVIVGDGIDSSCIYFGSIALVQ